MHLKAMCLYYSKSKKMKKAALLSIILLVYSLLHGQNIVITHGEEAGINLAFQDTTLSSISNSTGMCSNEEVSYMLDLDQDGENDIVFYLQCEMSGYWSWYRTSVMATGLFTLITDTTYLEHYQYLDSAGQVQDTSRTTTVARRFLWGDTIHTAQCSTQHKTPLLAYTHIYEMIVHEYISTNIDLFLGDTSYIAFLKNNEQEIRIYYLKIKIPYRSSLNLISGMTNEELFSISENNPEAAIVFPNPASDKIHFKGHYDSAEVYSLQGKRMISTAISAEQRELDISLLPRGYYVIKLSSNENLVITRFFRF